MSAHDHILCQCFSPIISFVDASLKEFSVQDASSAQPFCIFLLMLSSQCSKFIQLGLVCTRGDGGGATPCNVREHDECLPDPLSGFAAPDHFNALESQDFL
jgi:hypothetical protein